MAPYVRVELLQRKSTVSGIFQKGEVCQAQIRHNGDAVLTKGNVVLKPNEYRIYISDNDFDKLLQGGDAVA